MSCFAPPSALPDISPKGESAGGCHRDANLPTLAEMSQ